LTSSFNRIPLAQKLKGPYAPTPSEAEIDDAIQEFLAKGGTIQRMENEMESRVRGRTACQIQNVLQLDTDEMIFFLDLN
jgi:hypothetical protein